MDFLGKASASGSLGYRLNVRYRTPCALQTGAAAVAWSHTVPDAGAIGSHKVNRGGVMSSQTCLRAAALVGRIGWFSLAATAGLSAGEPAQAQDAAPITIVINQSPWFEGFRGLVEAYEEETGNQVELDVNPFAGSIEKQRSSARAPEGTIDLFVMNSPILPEMYSSGLLHSMDELDPSFTLDPGVGTFDDTVYWDNEK
jgi:multiple sugar transport system substrate-binding protein